MSKAITIGIYRCMIEFLKICCKITKKGGRAKEFLYYK
jgi:hypothetical protein